jgi:hypothetical protein
VIGDWDLDGGFRITSLGYKFLEIGNNWSNIEKHYEDILKTLKAFSNPKFENLTRSMNPRKIKLNFSINF